MPLLFNNIFTNQLIMVSRAKHELMAIQIIIGITLKINFNLL